MFRDHVAASRLLRRAFAFAAALVLALLSGCATHYVDGAIKEVPAAQFAKPAQPAAVQVVFEFQTKGVANARATDSVKPMVMDAVKRSGLFTQVQDKPVQGGALLSVKLNNIPLTDDAFAKGFMTGLTFGAAGSQVTDGYVCTVTYLGSGSAGPIVKTAKHAIHTTLGASGAPANAYKASTIQDAVQTMVRQVMSNALNDLSHDTQFK